MDVASIQVILLSFVTLVTMAANSKLEPLFSDELRYTSSIDQVGNLKWVQGGEGTIVTLFNRIQRSQITKDTAFRLFPLSWELQKGMYPNDVKLNFHGDFQYSLFRDKFRVPDNNMFTPAWVTSCLIEASMFGKSPKPSQRQIDLALNAIDKYRNHNKPYKNSEMTFWHQKLNRTANYYQSSPDNLFEVLKMPDYLPQKLIEEILSFMGLDDIEKVLEKLFREGNMFFQAFHIPPDFDDTFVNIGLGGLLALATDRGDHSESFQTWKQQNSNLTSVFESVKKYAYRPFSTTSNQTTIDPRTYMYLHTFLEQAEQNGQDVALISTWIQDTVEVVSLFDKGVSMPFNVNNVDITVSANFIYGIIMCTCTKVCNQPDIYIDTDIQQIFMNTTSLIAHELKTNLSSRPDLALTYYPSKFEFYWFVSRSWAYLNRFYISGNHRSTSPSIDKMLKFAYNTLHPVVQKQMTADIIQSTHRDTTGAMYVDDFLGDKDFDLFNRSENKAEDRIFTTAVSVNALINVWTVWNDESLLWQSDTPDHIKETISEMVKWINENVLSERYKPWNTFFSGSGKGLKSMPFFYPANRLEYFNGTSFPDTTFPDSLKNIVGMRGYVTSDEFAAMLEKPHFGMRTPETFDGYNSEPGGYFPFWSCDSYTYAVSLLALSQYENIKHS